MGTSITLPKYSLGGIVLNTANGTAAAIPAAVQEGFGAASVLRRQIVDFSQGPSEWRCSFHVTTPASAGAKAAIQYSINGGGAWKYLNGVASGSAPTGGFVSMAASGPVASPWGMIPSEAKTSVWVRPVTVDGDGVTTGMTSVVALQWR
jgi:hypothetical protein